MKRLFFCLFALICAAVTFAAPTITKQGGWYESAYVEWTAEAGATYDVFVAPAGSNSWTQLDDELVRKYSGYGRADALGLKAGSYQLKVVSSVSGEAVTGNLTVKAHDRSGFAHYNRSAGVGAYNNDGTLKANAKVIYVNANNAKTVKAMIFQDKAEKEFVGLQAIIGALEKGQETKPICVRIIGTIKAADMDAFGSSAEGLQVKGKSSAYQANLTIEGVGEDAAIHGFGILCRSISSVEFRNFAVMICMDDCLSLDTDNKNIWIHNMDFFYGGTGGDADQAKGDGTVDIKGKSSHVTVSYNHFYDSGKCSLGGMKSETTDCWMTYHHNWFDHSDSRHPRIRTAFYHVYNNYFDGNAKYGVGCTSGGSAFVESNFFRNCKYPMLISKQGTDAQGDGTFSGEPGGVITSFGNKILGAKQVLFYNSSNAASGEWDAIEAKSRGENITATAFSGGTGFNNAATAEAIKAVPASAIDAVDNVQNIVRDAQWGAGRLNQGDFIWKFNNAVQDENYGVIAELKSALLAYKSTLVGYFDGATLNNGGASSYTVAGDGKNIAQEVNDATQPNWGTGAGSDVVDDIDFEDEPFIAGPNDDIFWFGENTNMTKEALDEGIIKLGANKAGTESKYAGDFYTTTTSGGATYTSDHVGAFNIAASSAGGTYDGGSITFYCPNGVTAFKFNLLRSGDIYYNIEKSTNGVDFQTVANVTKAKAGVMTKDFSTAVRNLESKEPVWIRITNGGKGSLYIFGVQINQLAEDATTLAPCDLQATVDELNLNVGDFEMFLQGQYYTTTSEGFVTLSSSDNKIIDVANNVITAVGEGTATLTISVARSANMKAGTTTIKVNVVDPRSASTFAVTSGENVSLKETETSQIEVSGAAGAVTYETANSAIATVSSTGLITAVAAGSTSIYVTDAGSSTVKGTYKTINVAVTKDMSGKELVTFTYDGKTVKSSNSSLVGISTGNGKSGLSVSFSGETLTAGVKMESATVINITPSANATVTLVFDVAGKKFNLDGVAIANTNGTYSFTATGGKTYTLKKTDSMNLVGVLFDFGGGDNPGPGPGPGPEPETSTKLIDYPTSTNGVEIKGSTTVSGSTLQLKNGYVGTVNGVANTPGNGILLTVDGGFKAGDIVTIAGTISVKTSDGSYEKKVATTAKLATVTDDTPTDVYKFANFENTQETGVGTAGGQTFTLTEDYPELWLIRDGGTTATITLITVERPEATGISTILNYGIANGIKYDLQGRIISQPVKGQMFIMNGKKMIAK